jgi:hypothetical protein
MSLYQTAMKNYMASQYAAKLTYLGALTALGSGGTSAGTEPSGGSPAYARKSLVWGSPTAGVISATGVAVDIPSGATILGAGFYDIVSGAPTDYDQCGITSQTFSSQGQYTITPTYTQV